MLDEAKYYKLAVLRNSNEQKKKENRIHLT